MSGPVLLPWHKRVSRGNRNYRLINGERNPRLEKSSQAPETDPTGFYAWYGEGWFFVAEMQCGEVLIGWHGSSFAISEIHKINRRQHLFGYEIEIVCSNGETESFFYHGLAVAPWRLITDLLVTDDDWTLVFDLPGWTHSGFESGTLRDLLRQVILTES